MALGEASSLRDDLLDVIIAYINVILDDDFVTSNEAENVKFLKLFFKIKEGDFYKYKFGQIEKMLDRQFEHMYQDNRINTEEALQKVELQELFDLSYDQFLHLSVEPSGLQSLAAQIQFSWTPLSNSSK